MGVGIPYPSRVFREIVEANDLNLKPEKQWMPEILILG